MVSDTHRVYMTTSKRHKTLGFSMKTGWISGQQNHTLRWHIIDQKYSSESRKSFRRLYYRQSRRLVWKNEHSSQSIWTWTLLIFSLQGKHLSWARKALPCTCMHRIKFANLSPGSLNHFLQDSCSILSLLTFHKQAMTLLRRQSCRSTKMLKRLEC